MKPRRLRTHQTERLDRSHLRTFFPPRAGHGSRLHPEDALRAIRLARMAYAAPPYRVILERDATMMALVAFVDLPASLITQLTWADLDANVCRGLRINGNGLELHVALPAGVMTMLDSWRERLELRLGRPLRSTEALFPSLMPGTVPPRGDLAAVWPGAVHQAVRRRLLAAGVEDEKAKIRWLRGSLVGVDPSTVDDLDPDDVAGAHDAA